VKVIYDIGAGAAVWSLHCGTVAASKQGRRLTVVPVDFPTVLPKSLEGFGNMEKRLAAKNINLSKLVELRPVGVNILEDFDWPLSPDVVICGNIFHLFDAVTCRQLAKRILSKLPISGRVIVIDCFERTGLVSWASYSLHLALRAQNGKAHPLHDVISWFDGLKYELIDIPVDRFRGTTAVIFSKIPSLL